MNNEIALFEEKHLEAFKNLSQITTQIKQLEDQEKRIKDQLEKAMHSYNIKSIDNQYLKITYVDATSITNVDLSTLKEKEPQLYDELLTDYPKTTNRKGYLRFSIK